jgi:hypothetical protein
MNSVEFQEKGFQPEEAKELASILEANKFDFVELSDGTYEAFGFGHRHESTKAREAFFLEFADIICPVLNKTKVYVTGGFKTVGAMVNALKTVDGISLARPVCQEPCFCKDILAGRVTGAIRMQMDDSDFGITNIAAGTQIRQISKDQEPVDLSRMENFGASKEDMGIWFQGLSQDAKLEKYGYVDLGIVHAQAYDILAV